MPTSRTASREAAVACAIVPLAFGLVSVILGADVGEDVKAYHLYNAFAALHGKVGRDLAPAGFQSYFNPALDVLVYGLDRLLPAPVVGFLLGFWQGLAFPLLFLIARETLPDLSDAEPVRLPLFCAAVGCLTANYLSQIGSRMGDDTTAVLVLLSLLVMLRASKDPDISARGSALRAVGAGALCGLAVGFKLTNALYAVAICGSLISCRFAWAMRVRLTIGFVVGALAGFASIGAHWMWMMWVHFRNPLFPQLSRLFPNPLVVPTGIIDQRWRPHGLFEYLAWPFMFSIDAHRIGEDSIHQIIWSLAYVMFGWWLVHRSVAGWRHRGDKRCEPTVFLIVVVAFAYATWLAVFDIGRYLIPAELVLPIFVVAILREVLSRRASTRLAAGLLGTATAVVLLGGVTSHGHAGWQTPLIAGRTPAPDWPASASLLTFGGQLTWIATLFPEDVAVLGISTNFPRSAAYAGIVHARIAERGGPTYVLLDGARNGREDTMRNANVVAREFGATTTVTGCRMMRWAIATFGVRAAFVAGPDPGRCAIGIVPKDVRDLAAADARTLDAASSTLLAFGFTLDRPHCTNHQARLGNQWTSYQLCPVANR